MYIKKQPASIKRKKQLLLLSAEKEGNEPISLCRFNSTLYQYVNALGGTI